MDVQEWGHVMRTNFLRNRRLLPTAILAGACLLQSVELPLATTATTSFTVQITLANTCTVTTPATLNFGPSVGLLTANVAATTTFSVTCTTSADYTIGLNAGTGSGATVAARKMTNGGNAVTYSLYTDASHTTVWGNTPQTDTVGSTGTGGADNYTIYGLVPPQTTPPQGTYTDTITLTVTY